MIKKLKELQELAKQAAEPIKREKGKIHVVSHHDADGICAGSIIYKTLKKLGKDFDIEFVKQLEEPILKEISKKGANMFIFCDLGSGQLNNIKKYIPDRKVVVVDHHQLEEARWENLYLLNPYLVEVDGSEEISGSGVAYILSRELVGESGMVSLAIIGAVGDVQEKDGNLIGLNKILLEEARKSGKINVKKGLKLYGRKTRALHKAVEYHDNSHIHGVTGNESGAVQFLSSLGIPLTENGKWRTLSDLDEKEERRLTTALLLECENSAETNVLGNILTLPNGYEIGEFTTLLNACGRLEKPMAGLELCLGMRESTEEITREYRRKIAFYLRKIKNNKKIIIEKRNASYLIAKDMVDEAFIGTVISILLRSPEGKSILFGFANGGEGVKISARADKKLRDKINLGVLIKDSAEKLDGEGGGHMLAGGGKIPPGKEEAFIEIIDQLIDNNINEH